MSAPTGLGKRKWLLFGAVPVGFVVGFAAIGILMPTINSATAQPTSPGPTTTVVIMSSVKAGDCLIGDPKQDTTPEEMEGVDCDKPHNMEVYGTASVSGSVYPGDKKMFEETQDICDEAFSKLQSAPVLEENMDFFAWTPSEKTWVKGDRKITCYVAMNDSQQFTGSVMDGTVQQSISPTPQ